MAMTATQRSLWVDFMPKQLTAKSQKMPAAPNVVNEFGPWEWTAAGNSDCRLAPGRMQQKTRRRTQGRAVVQVRLRRATNSSDGKSWLKDQLRTPNSTNGFYLWRIEPDDRAGHLPPEIPLPR